MICGLVYPLCRADILLRPHRRAAFEYVHAHYARLDLEIIVADCEDPFTKARALNQAIGLLDSRAVVIQADPDSFVPDVMRLYDAVMGHA